MSKIAIRSLKKGEYHPDELTSKEHGAFIPFKVDLMVKRTADSDPEPYTMYMRAPGPYEAMVVCQMAFNYAERDRLGITGEYPDICTQDEAESSATGLYEDQYMEFWKEAQMARVCRHIGPKENPSWFFFTNDSNWDVPLALKEEPGKVFVGGELSMSDVAKMQRAKSAIDLKLKKKP